VTDPLPNVQPSPRVPKAALLLLIQTLSGVQTMWRTDAAPAIPGMGPGLERARIWLRLTSYGSVGVDEQREEYDPVADQNDIVNIGQRQLTLSIRAESLDANLEAFDLCERIRFRLRTWTARTLFAPAGLSLRDVQPIAVLEQKVDTRIMKVAVMDVRWNLVVFADPLVAGEGEYIAAVDGITVPNTGGIIPGTLT
jgi:hypothetical protein